MDKKAIKNLLSPESKSILIKNFSGSMDLFYGVAAELFEEDRLPLLEDLIKETGFQKFLNKRKNSGQDRLEATLYTILRRCMLEIPAYILAKIAEAMAIPEYRKMASSFYVIPIDKEGYEIFERSYFIIGEQKPQLLTDYLTYCSTDRWALFRSEYKPIPEVFQDLTIKLANHFLTCENTNEVMEYTKHLLDASISRFIFTAHLENCWQDFNMEFLQLWKLSPNQTTFYNWCEPFL